MLGSLDSSQSQVHVIGAGIAGLLMAYRLDQQGYEVFLYESQEAPGGLIRTERTSWGMAEWALHSCLGSASVVQLWDELNLDWLTAANTQKYLLREGKLRKFPLNFRETMVTCARACWVKRKNTDFHVKDWAETYLGKAAYRYLVAPMVQGIYGVTAEEIAQKAAFPQWTVLPGKTLLTTWLQRRMPRSHASILAPVQGMQALVEALALRLKERLKKRYLMQHKITSLEAFRGNIVVATQAQAACLLLVKEPKLAQSLARIKYAPLMSITVFVEKKASFPSGIGVLIPEGEKLQALGIFFNTSAFSGRVSDPSLSSFTVFLGGSRNPKLLEAPDSVLKALVEKDLSFLLGPIEIMHLVICRQFQAIPYYNDDLLDLWKVAEEGWCLKPGHLLFGNYTGQVSLRGMIESVSRI